MMRLLSQKVCQAKLTSIHDKKMPPLLTGWHFSIKNGNGKNGFLTNLLS